MLSIIIFFAWNFFTYSIRLFELTASSEQTRNLKINEVATVVFAFTPRFTLSGPFITRWMDSSRSMRQNFSPRSLSVCVVPLPVNLSMLGSIAFRASLPDQNCAAGIFAHGVGICLVILIYIWGWGGAYGRGPPSLCHHVFVFGYEIIAHASVWQSVIPVQVTAILRLLDLYFNLSPRHWRIVRDDVWRSRRLTTYAADQM